ncbi:hypothetical protein [Candidatus Schmidhempelia bombi]|uniref:hypothetical protein n=1 Tax=Candidatus Schmidhempelia bombi TaxID=1505866 RepID=UPI001416EF09|nr:hypothetical protein [Candidatus Schmidhempelia bombi]
MDKWTNGQMDKWTNGQIFYPVSDPYIITMALLDDRGKRFGLKIYDDCRYRDPNKKFKRT